MMFRVSFVFQMFSPMSERNKTTGSEGQRNKTISFGGLFQCFASGFNSLAP